MAYSNTYDFDPGVIPDINGKWLNKVTGEVITARDVMMCDDGLVVRTSTGGTIDMDRFSRDYIQTTDDTVLNNLKGHSVKNEDNGVDELELAKAFNEEMSLNKNAQNASKAKSINTSKFDMIDKVFTKKECKPDILVDIEWVGFPKDELKMLIEYFDITKEDIAQYICEKYVNIDDVRLAVTESIDL